MKKIREAASGLLALHETEGGDQELYASNNMKPTYLHHQLGRRGRWKVGRGRHDQ
jgi:hypothetical protein